jgi:hypothetical protein
MLITRIAVLEFFAGCLLFATAGTVHAQQEVSVALVSGRTVAGNVDDHSDDQYLWLRKSESNIEFISRFAWQEIASGTIGNQQMSASELQTWTKQNKSPSRTFAQLVSNAANQPDREVATSNPTNVLRQPVTLMIRASLGQWDEDVQTDGLEIELFPLDSLGQLCPVSGHVQITLVIEDEKLNGGLSIPLQPEFKQLERRSFTVRNEQFASGPARFQLPFRQGHPEFDPRIAPTALVHARLSIPGYKVLEASDPNVFVRECSRFRDEMQYYAGQRYLPIESNGQRNR